MDEDKSNNKNLKTMMQKLTPLDSSRLPHAEFGQLMVRFFEDFASSSLDVTVDSDFKKLYNALQLQIPSYNAALDQIRASEESKQIGEFDHTRDLDMKALRDSLKPYRNSRIQSEIAAYASLHMLLSEYKEVEDESYESETNKLNSLVARLQSSDYTSHVATMGIVKFINQLADSNTAFNTLFGQRSYKTSQKVVFDVKELRKSLAADYKKMTTYIATLATVKDDAYYKDVLAIINNGRNYFSTVVLARRTGKKSNVEKP
ncbi:DUF6261 family protein [Chryseobacterium wangxinyae]|uniref:DUF6261 family protein n=1 Tax=Chryseobacterium sp. CY353 TaxID=2997334 RepID=UPI00226E9FE0|nr:DUF6261 family protein [Chryseobacterium sp. CY353]MCY0968553.1 DUF6261 family protein [Chryseobacterium sp. CY353]